MINEAQIRAHRDALAAQLSQGQQQYNQLERTLRDLDRQLCALQGGIQELDALLAELEESTAKADQLDRIKMPPDL